ncbi:hypothetical protein LEP48_01820 [Isoptericola sp. NEAU-Y5]|uniref:Polyhydroxybutyrate depolymerase n=1 Tax=Isoptericola luteus TaxID=2879484 RepID=A0ABS7ZAJ9_9MICO|nr:PHB depolymerase family esterase [Isoptericola sp. NEAU-Y5]MCA5892088.1 hypothetical protein [Isoptericola sp. NEAU-Y5]
MSLPRCRTLFLSALVAALMAGCGVWAPTRPAGPVTLAAPADAAVPVTAGSGTVEIGGRPVDVQVPPGYDAADQVPLLVLLHGFGSDAARVDAQLALRAVAAERGVLYAVPEGSLGPDGRRFWNATDACCGRDRGAVDDSAYLELVLRTLLATYTVDPDHVAVVGYSNGDFMAYRTACDHADLVSVVVSLAGAMPADDAACAPTAPVRVVQAHGTDDRVIDPGGGRREGHAYPSALRSVTAWARLDGCAAEPVTGSSPRDLWATVPGPETTVLAWAGCTAGTRVELWSIAGAGHAPEPTAAFADAVLDAVLDTSPDVAPDIASDVA